MMNIPNKLLKIAKAIDVLGGRALIVGGAVRDYLCGDSPKDYDVEVYGVELDVLHSLLEFYGNVNAVGVSFGILNLRCDDGESYDFSLPRRENRIGVKHTDFTVKPDPTMSVRDAASRRDFTINSMAYDIICCELIDNFGGRDALLERELIPTSDAFSEDALRVLRGMQFAARFDMTASVKCMLAAENMRADYAVLAKERIYGEWEKWALKGDSAAKGLQFLRDCGWLSLYPELAALDGCPQDAEWHPEGDVFRHTCLVCQAMADICVRENITGENRVVLMFAALCHDLGKPATTATNEAGRITSKGHCEVGVAISEQFLQSIGCPQWIIDIVKPLVAEHLAHVRDDITPRTVRRLANRLGPANIVELCHLIEADMSGRSPLPKGQHESAIKILSVAAENAVLDNTPKPILMGRHLLERGMKPSPEMGRLLKCAYEAQLDGEFDTLEGALAWV